MQVNFSFWERSFILQLFNKGYFWGLFFYNKYLRNQGWKRCKTNVNFQLYIFSCRMEQFMKKGSIFFAAAQYCGRKEVIFWLRVLTQGLSFHFFSYLCKFLRSNLFVFFFFFAIFFLIDCSVFLNQFRKFWNFKLLGLFVCLLNINSFFCGMDWSSKSFDFYNSCPIFHTVFVW